MNANNNLFRIPKRQLMLLRQARLAASFECAYFGLESDYVFVGHRDAFGANSAGAIRLDEFVREISSQYRSTALLPKLDAVIEWAEQTVKK